MLSRFYHNQFKNKLFLNVRFIHDEKLRNLMKSKFIMPDSQQQVVILDGCSITTKQLFILSKQGAKIIINETTLKSLQASRKIVDKIVEVLCFLYT